MLEFLKQLWDTTAPALIAVKQTLDAITSEIPLFKWMGIIASAGGAICFIIKIAPKIPKWIRGLLIRV